jgi:hypothetical protein
VWKSPPGMTGKFLGGLLLPCQVIQNHQQVIEVNRDLMEIFTHSLMFEKHQFEPLVMTNIDSY